MQDISHLRQEVSYKSFFNSTHTIMLLIDPQTGNIVDANPAACHFYGYSKTQMADMKIGEINCNQPDQIKKEMELVKRGEKGSFIFLHKLASGKIRNVEVFSDPIEINGKLFLYSIIHDVTKRLNTESVLRTLTFDLGERLKELHCLYQVSKIIDQHGVDIDIIAREILDIIPPSMQFPEITCARIMIDDQIYTSPVFLQTPWKLISGIVIRNNVVGFMEIFYMKEIPDPQKAIFLEEEQDMLDAITEQLGRLVDRVTVERERYLLFEEVQRGRERLKMLSSRLLKAQEMERRQVARELHDEIGQVLTAVKINLQAAQGMDPSLETVARLDDSIAIVEQALSQVHDLSLDLRPSLLDDLGLVSAFRWYIDRQTRRSGINAQFNTTLTVERFPVQIETICFRVLQEAITNIFRHAHASYIDIQLHQDQEIIELTINDDGVGFDLEEFRTTPARGNKLGLLSMEERVLLGGGALNITSSPGKGTTIHVELPLSLQEPFEYDQDD